MTLHFFSVSVLHMRRINREERKEITEKVKKFYLTVSDKRIALKFRVSDRCIAGIRKRLGLRKSQEMINGLEFKVSRKRSNFMYRDRVMF